MDPRRARDPRLARADPRIQRPSSGSPVPAPAPQTPQQYQQQQWAENGVQNYSTPPPSQIGGQLTSYQQPPHQLQASPAPPPVQVEAALEFKQRLLFCVVCASNQVSSITLLVMLDLNLFEQNRSMVGHNVLA